MTLVEQLRSLGACYKAIEWASTYADLQSAWDACERGDWMAWLAGRLAGPPESEDRKRLVLALADCAELALPYAGELTAAFTALLHTARRWARGEAKIEDVQKARIDAYADAAAAAAYVARADFADFADFAADESTYSNDATAAAAACIYHTDATSQCADIMRAHYPVAPSIGGAL